MHAAEFEIKSVTVARFIPFLEIIRDLPEQPNRFSRIQFRENGNLSVSIRKYLALLGLV